MRDYRKHLPEVMLIRRFTARPYRPLYAPAMTAMKPNTENKAWVGELVRGQIKNYPNYGEYDCETADE
jgi:hypothetical protein